MKLKEILELIYDGNLYIGLSYIGQQDYALTTKQELIKNNDLLDKKVKSINAFKNKKRILGIKIFQK